MESCTGGAFANAITSVPGASEVYLGGSVCYSRQAKIRAGVPAGTLVRFGVYSRHTALAMARVARSRAPGGDIGIGITGTLTRPDPNAPDSVPGVVFIAVCTASGCATREEDAGREGTREQQKARVVAAAVDLLLGVVSGDPRF